MTRNPYTYLLISLLSLFISTLSTTAVGDELNLESYKGKVVYIDFWASWCGPCRQSFPWMNQLHQQKTKEGLVIIAVNVDQEKKLADEFIKELKPEFNIVFDSQGKLATEFKVAGMPSAYVIGRDGKPRYKHIGFHQDKQNQYEQEIQTLLDEQAIK